MHPAYMQSQIPKQMFSILNNLFEIEKKVKLHGDAGNILRNIEKIKDALSDLGYVYEDPTGQSFNQTRTDVDATITGAGVENLVIIDVIKPIVRLSSKGVSAIIQKGIVIVEQKDQGGANE